MSQIEKIVCSDCGEDCKISFEIPKKHEIYFMNTKGMIEEGTLDSHVGVYVNKAFLKDELAEITGDCEECGQVDVSLHLKNGDIVIDCTLENDEFWELIQ